MQTPKEPQQFLEEQYPNMVIDGFDHAKVRWGDVMALLRKYHAQFQPKEPSGEERKLLQLINDIEFMEDFIKVVGFDKFQSKIEPQTLREILRMISEMKERALK